MKSWREMGIDIDDLEEVARPWALREKGPLDEASKAKILEHGKITGDFGGWWKTLSDKDKVVTVGKVRTDLLNSNKIKWGDLIDHKTGMTKTLSELGFGLSGQRL